MTAPGVAASAATPAAPAVRPRPLCVAIGCSYRFEELNLIGEILKLNFKQPWETHAFCNLNVEAFRRYGRLIEFDLFDCFHHVPDPNCSPKNVVLNEAKRRQPLALLLKALDYFAGHEQDFMWVEGDFIAFDEERIVAPFDELRSWDVVANHFDFRRALRAGSADEDDMAQWRGGQSQLTKMPHGYVLPTPLYISGRAAGAIASFIRAHFTRLADGTRNHEGNLALIFSELGLKRKNFSAYFCVSYPLFREVDPNLMFFHPHNLFAAGAWLKERGITNGRWLRRIMTRRPYLRPVTWKLVRHDPRQEPVLSQFSVVYDDDGAAAS